MSDNTPKREFGSGCRGTPDVIDKYLEQLGFYRKHVATDSTSLFRVVSELCYDIQLYHGKVREECVKFMRRNRAMFTKDIRYGYDMYLNNLSRTRTYGGLLELRALALLHKANVFLFEPYIQGKWYMHNPKNKVTWRVFIGRDNHFDVVYPLEYMKTAAECQAIVYNILYTKVLRLPDVEYAVERMLHDPEDKLMKYEKNTDGSTVATTEVGQRLELQKTRHGTNCVLLYPHLCHFHNQKNFFAIERFFNERGPEEGCRVFISDTFRHGGSKTNPLLREPKISCVRQLLTLGITPFPYKAAKSIDPNIYRNVEYDVWLEMREERMIELLMCDKKFREAAKQSKRIKPVNRLIQIKKVTHALEQLKIEKPTPVPETEAIVSTSKGSDSALALAPYPMQSIYYPTPDPYTLNAFGYMTADANRLTFSDPIGVPTAACLFNNFQASPPLQFHAPSPLAQLQQAPSSSLAQLQQATSPLMQFQQAPSSPLAQLQQAPSSPLAQLQQAPSSSLAQLQQATSPLMQLHQTPTPTVQSNESLAMPDLITWLPHTLNHQPNVMMFDSPYQSPQQQHLPYLQQSPQHQLHQREQQQQQQIAKPLLPRCLFHFPNGTEANISMTYDPNPCTPLPPGIWRF